MKLFKNPKDVKYNKNKQKETKITNINEKKI